MRMGADCGSDHELLIAKFRLKLKKVGKTIRPFRYDLNQIPYDYTVEVRTEAEQSQEARARLRLGSPELKASTWLVVINF